MRAASPIRRRATGQEDRFLFLLDKNAILGIVIAVLGLFVLVGHHSVPAMDRDESRFAQASKQMLDTGDFVTVRFQDELRAKKPAGIYWLQSGSAAILGEDAIASYRLPSLIALLLVMFSTYLVGCTLYKPPRAILAAGAVGSALVVFAEAHLAKTDSVLLLLCMAQQYGLLRTYQSWRHGWRASYHAYLWVWLPMAAAILVKGPVAPLLAVTTVVPLLLWHRSLGWIRLLRLWRGVAIICVITLPWAILVTLATDGAFLDIAFRGDFLAKVASGQESHGAPPGTYLALSLVLLWPASLLLPRAAAQISLLLAHVESRFLLAWAVPFWVVMEFVPTKLPHYTMPVVPALMILAVCAVNAPLPGQTRAQGVMGGVGAMAARAAVFICELGVLAVGPVLGMAALWVAVQYGGTSGGRAFSFAILAALAGMAVMVCGVRWQMTRGVRRASMVLAAGAVFHLVVFAGLLPSLSRLHVSRAIDQAVRDERPAPQAIAAAGYHEPSLVFHLGQNLLLVDGAEAALFLAEAPGGLVILEERQRQAFLDTAQRLGLRLAEIEQIEGFNYSKGRSVRIFLYSAAGFDPAAARG